MRNYIVYFNRDGNSYRNPCGDRSKLIVDGRLNFFRVMNIAQDTGKQRGFDCFAIYRADSFRDVPVDDNPLVNLYRC